jgi:hypothetical protein
MVGKPDWKVRGELELAGAGLVELDLCAENLTGWKEEG